MLTLWEVLWTDYLGTQFHLFVALSILDQHREVIIEYLKNFDEILKVTVDSLFALIEIAKYLFVYHTVHK
jgi:hypothetical protein